MLSDLAPGAGDADRLTETVLSGRHDVVLDSDSQLFHILDGTGTDVTIVAGRAHAGGERPLVLIDLSPDGHGLAVNHRDLEDGGARDLGRLLRYDDAVAWGDDVTTPAPEVLVTPLWTADFCRTVIKAAEAASMWTDDFDDPNAGLGVWLDDISPRLFTLLKEDLDSRIAPLLRNHWPARARQRRPRRPDPAPSSQRAGRKPGGLPGREPAQRLGSTQRRLRGRDLGLPPPRVGRRRRSRRRPRRVAITRHPPVPRSVPHSGRQVPAGHLVAAAGVMRSSPVAA